MLIQFYYKLNLKQNILISTHPLLPSKLLINFVEQNKR
jgi:hypothetical protein